MRRRVAVLLTLLEVRTSACVLNVHAHQHAGLAYIHTYMHTHKTRRYALHASLSLYLEHPHVDTANTRPRAAASACVQSAFMHSMHEMLTIPYRRGQPPPSADIERVLRAACAG
jgi:hypothetical protein